MKRFLLPLVALPLLAASPPQRGLVLETPANPLTRNQPRAAPPGPPTAYEPAPLPNRDIDGGTLPRAGTSPSLSPSLFTRSDTYRGEGFSKGSTANSEQDRRVRPGVGFNLKMPLSPN